MFSTVHPLFFCISSCFCMIFWNNIFDLFFLHIHFSNLKNFVCIFALFLMNFENERAFSGCGRFSVNTANFNTVRDRQKIKWPYLRLHTTNALDFWYGKRYWQYLSWVVSRRRYSHFIFWRFRSVQGKATIFCLFLHFCIFFAFLSFFCKKVRRVYVLL